MASAYPLSHFKAPRPIPATHTLRLVQLLGPAKAARALGISQTTLSKIRTSEQTYHQNEAAASSWLKAMGGVKSAEELGEQPISATTTISTPGREDHAMILLDVPTEKVPVIEQLAKHLGAEFLRA